ncbi:GNAT family N-acetyltransferase [Ihubacter massiliensis]|uniref:GNAT family N-acetyltransferase n=1 Tax=Hominibacterium faecale TaxID=2839743 RepID=A0A9J6QIW8_9FIRM|nr:MULTISPECIES: GNAT family N-acetyltransferase [Eubacteriales Family XIII. Incertae Sedis]MCI7302976.1 GNAT family N-acetyltransferase [Clostridia bacterium]MDE8731719.1 GNAT family N-acetyltransferase [Eubacteriales bacterium DFI.9.88]MDY3012639.1 GNAT family N-acetyltransferase [Clostridiales Family XIII bacterium]MCO7122767.1 GNAT family N-acetyltransferase [Ihubacter massiliensis]MCU7377041.1 GNAT family N-acetyltransferase [Hominibacterium faecale]
MKIVIKKFHELSTEELYQILKLRSDVFVVEQKCAYPDCDGKDRHAHHLFVEQNNHIVGYLRILEKGQTFDAIAIGRVAVDPDYRGIGLARHMMNKALLFINEYLYEKQVKISAQQHLTKFYESVGFLPISESYLEDGIPHIDMEYRV